MEILARHYEKADDGSVILVDSHTGEVLDIDDTERKFIERCENKGVFSWHDNAEKFGDTDHQEMIKCKQYVM